MPSRIMQEKEKKEVVVQSSYHYYEFDSITSLDVVTAIKINTMNGQGMFRGRKYIVDNFTQIFSPRG